MTSFLYNDHDDACGSHDHSKSINGTLNVCTKCTYLLRDNLLFLRTKYDLDYYLHDINLWIWRNLLIYDNQKEWIVTNRHIWNIIFDHDVFMIWCVDKRSNIEMSSTWCRLLIVLSSDINFLGRHLSNESGICVTSRFFEKNWSLSSRTSNSVFFLSSVTKKSRKNMNKKDRDISSKINHRSQKFVLTTHDEMNDKLIIIKI